MKRRLFKLVLFLLLGAVVNVAVAWGCAIKLDIRKGTATSLYRSLDPNEFQTKDPFWMAIRRSRPRAMHLFSHRGTPHHGPGPSALESLPESLVPNWARDRLIPWQSSSTTQIKEFGNWTVDARGWPQLSLWCIWARSSMIGSGPAEGGIQLPERWVMEHDRHWLRVTTLPYRPIWHGFVINTIFYAVILWLPFAPFQLRRHLRIKRGLCLKCGYDLRETSGGCPECGWGREAEA